MKEIIAGLLKNVVVVSKKKKIKSPQLVCRHGAYPCRRKPPLNAR